ncbi:NrtA/SsuA/CpmA family ABC transporter substrate-binding protein [Dactylosporangium sp. NPDC051485]|uniref:ABC transporter substrate-binding protein n=1 Tax=Dactylosporangium sp. NPDC051485 TaxID=3154846 RepID=UPI00342B677C
MKVLALPPEVSDVWMPLYAANSEGIAAKNGIKFEVSPVQNGAALVTGVVSGVAPLSTSALGAAVNAIKGGANIVIIGPALDSSYGYHLMAKAGSGITEVSQLAGKKIGVSGPGGAGDQFVRYTLQKHGIKADLVSVGSAGQESALLEGKVDAAFQSPPNSWRLLTSGKATTVVDYAVEAKEFSVWIGAKDYVDAHPEVVRKVLTAWYQTVVKLQNDQPLAVQILTAPPFKETPEVATKSAAGLKGYPTSGEYTEQMVLDNYKVLGATQDVSTLPKPSDIATKRFADVRG